LNEAPTVFLVVIVLLAIFKDNLPTDITTWVISGMIIAMAATIHLYAKKRRQDKESSWQRWLKSS
jgi:putative membrane protein